MRIVSSMLKLKSGLRPTRLDDCKKQHIMVYQLTRWFLTISFVIFFEWFFVQCLNEVWWDPCPSLTTVLQLELRASAVKLTICFLIIYSEFYARLNYFIETFLSQLTIGGLINVYMYTYRPNRNSDTYNIMAANVYNTRFTGEDIFFWRDVAFAFCKLLVCGIL